jgi:hypothetical protein
MTDNHPIIPPDELVEKWRTDYMGRGRAFIGVAKEIAQWGADQELEAVIDLAGQSDLPEEDRYFDGFTVAGIRANRRRTSLKEQALEQLREVNAMLQFQTTGGETSAIRRALEALPDNTSQLS